MTSSRGSERFAVKLVAALLILVAGWATGLATVVLHGIWWGLLLAGAASLVMLAALGRAWWSRLPFGLGWVVCVGSVLGPRGEGDLVVAGDVSGYLLVALAVVVFVVSVVTVASPRRVAGPDEGVPTYH
ncbi:MAG: hypothetical protein ACRDOM_09560 [Nocardioides sp.]